MSIPANSLDNDFDGLDHQWTKSNSYVVEGIRYDVYEKYPDSCSEDERPVGESVEPRLNLKADEATLNCLKWLLIDQKDVEHEIKTAPELENYEYASSDEEIWKALSVPKKKKEEKRIMRNIFVDFTCEWGHCNLQFAKAGDYRAHIAKHFQEFVGTQYDEYLCEWDMCGFKTDNLVSFERHVCHHEMLGRYMATGEAIEIFHKLPKCQMGGGERNRLPDLPKDFECLWKGCGKTFRVYSVLRDHVKDHYDEVRKNNLPHPACEWHPCNVAGTVETNVRFRAHFNIHVYAGSMACRKCGLVRKKKTCFIKHFLQQATVKNPELSCPHCGVSFLNTDDLELHIKLRHHLVECDYCDIKLYSQRALRTHVATTHLKLKPFKCTLCGRAFGMKYALKNHMYTHDPPREGGYPCSHCDYVANSYRYSKVHIYKKHMGRDYPYECHLCGQQFSRTEKIGNHFKSVHQLAVPHGFNRFTYKLDEGPVYHLRLTKADVNADKEPKEKKPKKVLPPIVPMKMDVKLQVIGSDYVVELKAEKIDPAPVKCEEPEAPEAPEEEGEEEEEEEEEDVEQEPRIVTRSRAAKLLETSKS